MPKEDSGGFSALAGLVLRKVFENIESRFVYMPLGLFVLMVLAYPVTRSRVFVYGAFAFALLAFAADWVGRRKNRQAPPAPNPQASSYREDIFRYLSGVQAKAVRMLIEGKESAARALMEKNLKATDQALKTFPEDADFHALLGYTLKDIYQSSKELLSNEQRKAYLQRAGESFEHALKLDPNHAGAHNGMGNVFFFQGQLDEAVLEHDKALELSRGNYPEAAQDKKLVLAVKSGEIPFEKF